MSMVTVRIAELEGPALDWAVAVAIGHRPRTGGFYPVEIVDWNRPGTKVNDCRFEPSTDWAQGGPLINEHRVLLSPVTDDAWMAMPNHDGAHQDYWEGRTMEFGPAPLIAAMRAIVAAHTDGDTVEVPAELVEGDR